MSRVTGRSPRSASSGLSCGVRAPSRDLVARLCDRVRRRPCRHWRRSGRLLVATAGLSSALAAGVRRRRRACPRPSRRPSATRSGTPGTGSGRAGWPACASAAGARHRHPVGTRAYAGSDGRNRTYDLAAGPRPGRSPATGRPSWSPPGRPARRATPGSRSRCAASSRAAARSSWDTLGRWAAGDRCTSSGPAWRAARRPRRASPPTPGCAATAAYHVLAAARGCCTAGRHHGHPAAGHHRRDGLRAARRPRRGRPRRATA